MPIVTLQIRGVLVVEALDPPQYAPTVQPITVAQGTDLDVRISVIDSYGAAVDLTNCSVVLGIRPSIDVDPVIQRLAVVTDAAAGLCVCSFAASETGALDVATYVYDVWLTQGNGLRSQLVPSSNWIVTAAVVDPGTSPTIPMPSILGKAGQFLSNDGTNLLWQVVIYLRPRGAWSSSGVYALNDIVQDVGATYRCKLAVGPSATHPAGDGTHFELWAAKGADGSNGSPGIGVATISSASPTLSGSSPPDLFATFSALAPGPALLGLTVGMPVVAMERTDFLQGLYGTISAINTGAGTITVQIVDGIGGLTDPTAFSSWTIAAGGFQGVDGKGLNPNGNWGSGVSYSPQDLVTYGGGSYVCTNAVGPSATPPDADGAHWQTVASQGAPGAAGSPGTAGSNGSSISPHGTWNSGAVYHALDLVTYNGSSYTCTATVGPTATTPDADGGHWQLAASRGDDGATGPAGPPNPFLPGVLSPGNSPYTPVPERRVILCYGDGGSTMQVNLPHGDEGPPVTRYCEWEVVDATGTATAKPINIACQIGDKINGVVNGTVTIATNYKRRIVTSSGNTGEWVVSGEF